MVKRSRKFFNGANSGDAEWSIWDHLEKFRWHILRSLGVMALLGIVLFIFNKWFFDTIIFGPSKPDFISYKVACAVSQAVGAGDVGCFSPPVFRPQAIGFGEAFITSIIASFMAGFLLAFPYLLWELWRFFGSFISAADRRAIRGVVAVCSVLFILGVTFGYFVLAPFSISWLIGYTLPEVENIPTLSSYINFMILFTIPMGLIFELPVIVFFLARLGLLGPDTMRTYRRHAIVGILLLAGIITPTVDGITQLIVATPLYILYELSIIVAKYGKRLYERNEEEEEEENVAMG